jgi:hypothetical protein
MLCRSRCDCIWCVEFAPAIRPIDLAVARAQTWSRHQSLRVLLGRPEAILIQIHPGMLSSRRSFLAKLSLVGSQFKGTRDIKRPSDFNGSSPDSDMDEAESEGEEGPGEGMDDVTVRDIPGPPPPAVGASSSAPWELFPRPPPRATVSLRTLNVQTDRLSHTDSSQYRVPEPSGDSETPIALADFFTRAPPPPLLPPPSPPPMPESSLPRGDFGLGGAMVNIFKSKELPEGPSYHLSADYPPLPSNAHPSHPHTDLPSRESTTSSGVTRWRPGGNPASFDVGVHSDPSQPGYRPPSPDSLALWGDPARVVTGVSRKDYEVKDLFE